MRSDSSTSFSTFYTKGYLAPFVQVVKSPGGVLNMIEAVQPGGDVSRPALPELTVYQDIDGGSNVAADLGGGRFRTGSQKGGFYVAAPDFANWVVFDREHHIRALSFPVDQWQNVIEEASDGRFSLECPQLHVGQFRQITIQAALQSLWTLSDEEGAPSQLLARAAGCKILAELFRLTGRTLASAKGGLAPWAERRCLELMHARLSEDLSLDELAAEARLSLFHFARMFKGSIGVPPLVYLTHIRIEKACELLQKTDMSVTEIALEIGYSSNRTFARVFLKRMHVTPGDYRRAVRDRAWVAAEN